MRGRAVEPLFVRATDARSLVARREPAGVVEDNVELVEDRFAFDIGIAAVERRLDAAIAVDRREFGLHAWCVDSSPIDEFACFIDNDARIKLFCRKDCRAPLPPPA